MLQVVYISTARAPLGNQELGSILAISRRNNTACGVTGLLLSGGRRFLQALEGPDAAVMKTFERIRADPRHFAMVELDALQIETRSFGSWAMASQAADGIELRAVVTALTARIEDPNLRAQFVGFAQLHALAA